MVAIFTGSGTGFERGSGSVLGSLGLLGTSAIGRGGDQLFLNAATGNLLINRQDQFLLGLGPDATISRTYNSFSKHADKYSAAVTPSRQHIIFPSYAAEHDFTQGENFDWLVHETFHSYQYYKSVIPLHVWLAGHEDPKDYAYTLNSRPFSGYGVEQQASMMGDLYRRDQGLRAHRSTNPLVSADALRRKIFGN